ncbi:DUF4330 domain-containing protein [bacterium]|nr:DUF4330 domain-containing protein [bacterium]
MIIDEKGRLFGLINVFDLCVLVTLLLMIYLGVSALIAVRQTPIEIVSVTPDNALAGQNPEIDVQINNTKYIKSCQVRLVPVDFQGETYQYEGQLHLAARDHIYFMLSPKMAPGKYRVELELIVQDNFRRNSVVLAQPEDKILTLTRPEMADVSKQYWQIEAEALVPVSAASRLKPQAEYRDSSDQFSVQVERLVPVSPAEAKRLIVNYQLRGGVSLASLKFYVPFSWLGDFQRYLTPGSRIVLETPAGEVAVWMTGQGELKPELPQDKLFWILDLMLLVHSPEQRAVIKAGASQNDDKGQVLAEVQQVLGEEPTAWIAPSAAAGPPPSNLRVRVKLLCDLRQGRLSWCGQPLEPKSILRFEFGGQELFGNLLGQETIGDKVSLNILFPVVEERFSDNLQPGVILLDPTSREQVGQITAVLDRAPVEVSTAGFGDADVSTEIGKHYLRVLARADLFYQMRGVNLYVGEQTLGPNANLSFGVFSETLPAKVWQYETFDPPQQASVRSVWITARAQFGPVDPNVAALVKPGLKDTNDSLNVDLELEKVLSDEPVKVMFVGQNGISYFDNPALRNLICNIRLKAEVNGDLYYFRGARLIIGSPITFQSVKFNLSGRVEDF